MEDYKEIMKLMAEKGFDSFDELSEWINNFPPRSAKDIEDKLAKLINPQPQFTFTPEEVEIAEKLFIVAKKWGQFMYDDEVKKSLAPGAFLSLSIVRNSEKFLNRIKQWKDENATN